ncbi:helix-turn-helix transcriptional regulator [Nocardioides panacisoli]|uniref:helix-turn-helix domain-containing protein n=1 Tax=Nocardioides panacisoli TaxID=627624 RepID=UPI001C63617A|nr:helix-turn-helix transcriptional regulator [Nocardioides panacisoli]QYJ03109.1 helix-turn-helix transcriptional regulator [Nocardioides panacisoli]
MSETAAIFSDQRTPAYGAGGVLVAGVSELDVDQRAVVESLRAAVRASGLTQQDFARAVGTSPSRLSAYLHGDTAPSARLLVKFQRIGTALHAARQEGVPTALDAGTSLRRALEVSTRPSGVLRFALEARDRLRDTLENRPHLIDAWDAKPMVGEERWGTLLAVLVAHEFTAAGRSAPWWTSVDPLAVAWFPARGRLSEGQVREVTPEWLAVANIWLAASALEVA